MSNSLNEKFKAFIAQLPSAEVIDDLPVKFDRAKRADFLVENRKAVIELKSLETDPESKVHEELKNHEKREEYPLFYGNMEIEKVLKHLPDGEEVKTKLFYKLSRSIEQSFRQADKQIAATKEILSCQNSFGILVLLNQDISVLSPELISCRVSQLLTKTDGDGMPHYKNVTSVWLILENFILKSGRDVKLLPSIMIDGPAAVNQPELTKILDALQGRWAAFNGVPLATADIKKISNSYFKSLSEVEKENEPLKPRHEIWRMQYRTKPYLRSLSDEDVLNHGARLIKLMAPGFIKDGPKIPFDQVAQFMEGFTHFIEEVCFRGVDMKKMPKLDID
jgi:hypothetical protein